MFDDLLLDKHRLESKKHPKVDDYFADKDSNRANDDELIKSFDALEHDATSLPPRISASAPRISSSTPSFTC